VYDAYRNELPAIAAYIPDIQEIMLRSKSEREGGATIHNEWVSSAQLPRGVNRVIRPEHLRWDDYAEWDDENHWVDWHIGTRVFRDAVTCGGRNAFVADGEHTLVRLSGNLDIDLVEIPGVPRLVAKRLRPAVERFLISLITPNLQRVNACLQQYLDENT
jgi:hypothetical protein